MLPYSTKKNIFVFVPFQEIFHPFWAPQEVRVHSLNRDTAINLKGALPVLAKKQEQKKKLDCNHRNVIIKRAFGVKQKIVTRRS